MTVAVPAVEGPAPLVDALRSEPSVEDVVGRAWESLASGRPAACPVCAGAMTPRYGAGATAVGGRCGECGSQLA